MANIKVLVGTVYGNALDVAEFCAEFLQTQGHSVQVIRQAEVDDLLMSDTDIVLVSTSTTGQGEIPDNLLLLYCQLKDRLPTLSHLKYGLIALGDSSYESFAEAGYLMDGLFRELTMQRLGEPLFIDACETMAPCDDVAPWIAQWEQELQSTTKT